MAFTGSQQGPPRRAQSFRRRSRWIALLAALTLPATFLVAPASFAADGPFDVDGVVPDPVVAQLEDAEGNVKELGPLNSSTTKIGVIHGDAVPTLGLTNPNGQVDLRRAWLGTRRESNKDWLYFAWERDANSGSGFIAYEFMQDPPPASCAYDRATDAQLTAGCNPWDNRKAGDFMILWDQQGNSLDLYLRTWSGSGDNLTLSPPGTPLNAAVSQARYSADGFRGEAAVNLTDTVFGGSNACKSFANTIPSTVTGNSDTADYKDTILQTAPPITNCVSETVTTPQVVTDTSTTPDTASDVPSAGASIGTGVLAVADSAVVSVNGGTAAPSGSVSFWLCKLDTDLCTSGGTPVGSTSLTGTSYPVTVQSPTAYVTSAGRYCWRAVFSGDSDNGIPGSADARESECFIVNPVTPTLSTSAGPDVLIGNAVTDTATLSGTATQPANPVINTTGTAGAPAGGTIVFKLYGPSSSSCGALVDTRPAVTVSGNGTYNAQSTPTAPGDYHWVAVYSGNGPNTNGVTHNADCTDTAEDVTVTDVPSSLTSAQEWVPNDSVTVSAPAGSGNLAGTVTFALYASADCAVGGDVPLYSVTRPVAGASPQTVRTANSTAQLTSGSFSWSVSYDSTNAAQRDIPASCHETSALTVANGGTVSSP